MVLSRPARLLLPAASLALLSVLLLAGCQSAHRQATNMTTSTGASPMERAVLLLQIEARSKDPSMRANCIEALQPLNDDRSQDVIEQGLRDDEWVVRFAAAMATGKRKIRTLKPVLESLADKDPNASVQVAAVYSLARLNDTSRMNRLAQTINSPEPGVRANTALVLGLLGDKSAAPLLNSRKDESDPRVRFEFAAALARLGDSNGTNALIAFTVSKYLEDHLIALSAWPDVPSPESADVLVSGLKATEPTIKLVAARGLGKIGQRDKETLLGTLAYTKDSDPKLRALAALALGDLLTKDDPNLPALTALLDDSDQSVRIAAAAAVISANSH